MGVPFRGLPGAGKGMFALTDLDVGDLILRERPLCAPNLRSTWWFDVTGTDGHVRYLVDETTRP